jgi:isopentenyl phosphate kinase
LARAVVAKLGGSVITDKSKPFSYRQDVVSALSEEIGSSDRQVVVVHGGGSFGHVAARQNGISSTTAPAPAAGVAQVRGAMYDLDRLVCRTMMEFKLSPYPFSPFDSAMAAGRGPLARWLRGLLKSGLTPVTFGDVVLASGGFKVMSGDNIVLELTRSIQPERCVFALDVDGVYEVNTRVIVPELTPTKLRRMRVPFGDDVTGGMRLKLDVAARIASLGSEVCFVSGYRRNEFSKALKGQDFYGTIVRA